MNHRGGLAVANRVDPDQTPQNAASDQGLPCLPHSSSNVVETLLVVVVQNVKTTTVRNKEVPLVWVNTAYYICHRTTRVQRFDIISFS